MSNFDWSSIREKVMTTIAAQVIPQIEKAAIALLLKNGEQLRGKGDLALNLLLAQYKTLTAATPLGLTDLDDVFLKEAAKKALDKAWGMLDERVKQAARDVGAALPDAPKGEVTVTDPQSLAVDDDTLNRPATAEDFGPSMKIE